MSNSLNKLVELINTKLKKPDADYVRILAERYYSHIDPVELLNHSIEELYAIAELHWNMMQDRAAGEIKIELLDSSAFASERKHRSIVQISVDNSPFLVDSILMCLNRLHYKINMMLHFGGLSVVKTKNKISSLSTYNPSSDNQFSEAPICIEIDAHIGDEEFKKIKSALESALNDVRACVEDWPLMRNKMQESIDTLAEQNNSRPSSNVEESIEFLRWLLDNHFTFLGCRDYTVTGDHQDPESMHQELIAGTGLGVLRNDEKSKKIRPYNDLTDTARKIALSTDSTLIISKTNTRSTVHRDAYSDYIGVKLLDAKGNLKFERRFIGLFTSSAYSSSPKVIPFLREKVFAVLHQSELPVNSHSGKDLMHILSTLPRDDLFHSTVDELYNLSLGILHMQDRRQVRLFTHIDVYGRYVSCLVYMPKENFNTDILLKIRDILLEGLDGVEITFNTYFDENVLCRIHYVVRVKSKADITCNTKVLESKIIEVSDLWDDALSRSILDYFGSERGADLSKKYQNSFHAGYREAFLPRHAIFDIEKLERLQTEDDLEMTFYRPLDADPDHLCLKLYHLNNTIPLSDALPILENLGLRVIGEQPYVIDVTSDTTFWVNDFNMQTKSSSYKGFDDVKDSFQLAFKQIWSGNAENDQLNSLVLYVGLNWREINVLRAYAAYFRQTGTSYSQRYIEQTLVNNCDISAHLINFFNTKFNPEVCKMPTSDVGLDLAEQIIKSLENVKSRDEDHILRFFVDAIHATTRTNFFQSQDDNAHDYISFKFNPELLHNLPLPKPKHEIYVYSSAFEGIHLRGGDVARGGLRWSDRQDDFRKEVLGLMKAQIVKNSVIVPTGAKGGFIVKLPTENLTREEFLEQGITCYKNFIRALLSLTDNYLESKIILPVQTICYDDPDPYLVVAADKGTATFSDIANAIATDEYDFWLGDAFASGGRVGYDHKKMGITARGAWVAALNHFDAAGLDIKNDTFTVSGIGDMSGDVFGNGLLMSDNAKLVAAFNHLHIFLDPNPDSKISFKERQRLFALPRSGWADYNPDLISDGGGVFSRSAKSIQLNDQLRELLGVEQESVEPSELIRFILKMQVDLLWNGGIGTYVKSELETDHDVGDRANDAVRVNGSELGARIVAEGGNLGLTQRGRIEYALAGGRLNTDFIDNSAGVDCSDHEVNIKILLSEVMRSDNMSEDSRNKLLQSMSDSVAEHVLSHNERQNEQLTISAYTAYKYINLYERYIEEMEKIGALNRRLSNLPDARVFQRRAGEQLGLTRPELAVLMSHTKIYLKQELLKTQIIDDPYMLVYLFSGFPDILKEKYATQLFAHRLKKEIIITEFVHAMVSDMGISFVYQLQDELGSSIESIAIAYEAAKHIFNMESILQEITALKSTITSEHRVEMTIMLVSLVRRSVRWIVREYPSLSISEIISRFSDGTQQLSERLSKLVLGGSAEEMAAICDQVMEMGAPKALAEKLARTVSIYHSLNIIEASKSEGVELFRVAKTYFTLADKLELQWVREQIDSAASSSRWTILAKAAFKAQLDDVQRKLTCRVLNFDNNARSIPGKINNWADEFTPYLERWQNVVAGLRIQDDNFSFAIISVALKELTDLAGANAATQ